MASIICGDCDEIVPTTMLKHIRDKHKQLFDKLPPQEDKVYDTSLV